MNIQCHEARQGKAQSLMLHDDGARPYDIENIYIKLRTNGAGMGSIDFEGRGVKIDDLEKLNNSPEITRIGLTFERQSDCIWASTSGNVAAYYIVLREVKRRLISGSFNVNVELSNGEKKTINLASSFVLENNKDITELIERK